MVHGPGDGGVDVAALDDAIFVVSGLSDDDNVFELASLGLVGAQRVAEVGPVWEAACCIQARVE